ncbi:hypothetical protein FHG89_05790 [Micromonospora orduensis]|uniref:DUF4760 domain-containing protein n=1 Tax=Micromonospora orduensis TaxID=1420891 RepID=A0A5C4QXJ7_9ACTN|nr:hypothetical protein [Micromonospora orduensis]TNH30761.1 hypothetical protein FHG89_05790 [Micromonospora orduensis]
MDVIAVVASALSAVVALIAARFALQNAKGALRSAEIAGKGLQRQNVAHLFQGFAVANEATLEHPELLYEVHGLDRSVSLDEARSIAYLSVLLDAFQGFYDDLYDGDFARMATEMKGASTFLNKVLAVPANRDRWRVAQELYYGDFDRSFIDAVNDLLDFEQARAATESAVVAAPAPRAGEHGVH